jgi:hypothetical protein
MEHDTYKLWSFTSDYRLFYCNPRDVGGEIGTEWYLSNRSLDILSNWTFNKDFMSILVNSRSNDIMINGVNFKIYPT